MTASEEAARKGQFRWQSLRTSSINVRIRGQILAFLDESRLEPGARLPAERDLAVRLGVSRPSVREAIKTLEAEGRLEVRHGNGVFVVSSAEDALRHSLQRSQIEIAEVYAMREVLEVPAARWAAHRCEPSEIKRVNAAHNKLLEASERGVVDFDEVQLLDAAFHQSIVQAAGNQFLAQTQGVLAEILLRGMTTTLTVQGKLEASRVEHRAILDAIVDGDGRRAGAAARAHVRAAGRVARIMVGEAETLRGV